MSAPPRRIPFCVGTDLPLSAPQVGGRGKQVYEAFIPLAIDIREKLHGTPVAMVYLRNVVPLNVYSRRFFPLASYIYLTGPEEGNSA
jgi:hypothetical protein